MKELKDLLKKINAEIDFNDPKNFIETGSLDSFDIVMLVSTLDETYDIAIKGLDIIPENFLNLESIWNLVEKYRSAV